MLLFLPFVRESLNLLAFCELCFLSDLHVACYGAVKEKNGVPNIQKSGELFLLEVIVQEF